jgi:hypothetical protein
MELPLKRVPRTVLELAPSALSEKPAVAFVTRYAEGLGMATKDRQHLAAACEAALIAVVRLNAPDGDEPVRMDLFEEGGRLVVEITNRGVPMTEDLHLAARGLDRVSVENLGRQGQKIVLQKRIGEAHMQQALARPARPPGGAGTGGDGQAPSAPVAIGLRDLAPGEEALLAQLFHRVYGYSYINEVIYYPEKIGAMLASGHLISIVAADRDGRLVGHVGLVRWGEEPPVYEAALGLVDPGAKSRGLFSRLFERTMERVRATPMQYCFFDFVTNHDRSQKVISRYGTCDMAILVGCQGRETQASLEKLGMGEDPREMDRYSLLFSIIPRVSHPFGREVSLPPGIGEPLSFLLPPLGLTWVPAPRFATLPAGGEYRTHLSPQQRAVRFDMGAPGRAAAGALLADWQRLLRDGYEYAAVDVPVASPGLGNLQDILSGAGFFVAGFLPYHHSDRLAFRFQALGPTRVALDQLKLATPAARRLLDVIRRDCERRGLA